MITSTQIKEALNLTNLKFSNYNKIAVCGMGGSGISGFILRDLIDKPVFICQSYNIPKFIDNKTLVFIISYSGNTKETISMYKQAKKKTKKLVIITSGGILSRVKNAILIPKGLQPRFALAYLFFPMWKILNKNIKDVIKIVDSVKNDLGIAKKLYNKLPVIYSSDGYYSVALRWKQQINEDSKRLAIANVFPEINHNEIESNYKNAKIIFLKNKDEKAIKILMEIVKNTNNMRKVLLENDLVKFAGLLNNEWLLRKKLHPGITTKKIEKKIAFAKKNGALAAKVCGAGGGDVYYSMPIISRN